MSKPGFYFYTGDWLKDTRVLTAATRGCWMDALCFLNEHGGSVLWPISSFANFWAIPTEQAISVLDELRMTNVADVLWQNDGKTLANLSNRRMIREAQKKAEIKQKRAEAGKKGAAKRWQKWQSSSSTSLNLNSSHSYKNKNEEPTPASPEASPDRIDARIKAVSDGIYNSDPQKFAKLIVWIRQAVHYGYSVDVIVSALVQFTPHAQAVKAWYPYLDKILEKEDQRQSGRTAESEHLMRKKQEAKWSMPR